jgi:hypothetical protein
LTHNGRPLFIGSLLIGLLLSVAFITPRTPRAAETRTQASPTEIRVNQTTTADQHEPTLTFDPLNPQIVLAAAKDWRTGPKQVWYYRSTDGGATWADGHIDSLPGELPNQSDPVITFDNTGTAYFALIVYNQNDLTVGGIFVVSSHDAGLTWGKPSLVSANNDTLFNDKEWIVVDNSSNPSTRGTIYVTWTLFTKLSPNRERGDIVISRSTDGGVTFSPNKIVSLPAQDNNQGSYPVVGPNGEVYVLYYTGTQAMDDEEGEMNSRSEEAIHGLLASSSLALQTSGRDALYVAKSTDGGETFAQVRKAANVAFPPSPLPGSSFRIFVLPTLAIDPHSGALYATWNDYSAGDTDIILVSSTDGGATWSSEKRVNDDPGGERHDQFFPAAHVGADGTLHLLWLDRRDDPGNKRFAPYYARSTDGGTTFSKNTALTQTLSDPDVGFQGVLIGDYLALDVTPDGSRVGAAWVDTRNGDQDIYFSSFDAATGPSTVPPSSVAPTPAFVPSPQPLSGFTDDAFALRWAQADEPVLRGKSQRPWLWGPASFAAANEPYAQGVRGTRQVQYFDKARMEINNTAGNRDSPFFVTNGLLVVELISGRIQIGDNQFEVPRPPADIPVAGDANSPDALTYASLAPVASLNGDKRAQDRTGQGITAVLDRSGQVHDDPARAGNIKLVRYDTNIGHNIPDVFWAFMNSTGPIYNPRFGTYANSLLLNWETDLGYPFTEPYWTSIKVSGVQKWVLVQAFQRRVLTYVADNPPGWQVEMGNVGRHYFDWRYRQIGSQGK